MMKFVRYLRRCWLKHAPMWNHFDHAGPRTTNAVEGYHNGLHVVTAQYPTISLFLRKLRQLHDKHLTQLTQLAVLEGKGKAKLPKLPPIRTTTPLNRLMMTSPIRTMPTMLPRNRSCLVQLQKKEEQNCFRCFTAHYQMNVAVIFAKLESRPPSVTTTLPSSIRCCVL
uniref:Uncharacterized protein n=1 Tax=Plectus sambesii TaxID=2011161 RepID=A0A914VN37_9BILA